MPLFKQTLSALMLTLYAATAAAISVPTPEEAKRQGLGLCFPRENPKPPASVYYAKRSSPYPKMLMFIEVYY